MDRRLGVVLLAAVVLLAGCSSLTGGTDGAGATTPTESTPTATQTPTPTATATATPTATATAEDPVPDWYEPKRPNTPIEPKLEESQGNRLVAVEVAQRVETESGGYSDFKLRLAANTSMSSVDPADHGTPRGEPYFVVYAREPNGSWFGPDDGAIVQRTGIVTQEDDGEFAFWVPGEALQTREMDTGEVELLVLLLDEDSEYDDMYGRQTLTVEYTPAD